MRKLLVVLVAVLASGCMRPTAPQPFTPEDVHFDAPPAEVWQALTMVYTDLGLPIENMDRSSWFLRSDEMVDPPSSGNADLFDCGETAGYGGGRTIKRAAQLTMNASITTLLVPSGGGTDVRNRVNVTGLAGTAPVTCYSRGVLEQRIVGALRERL